MNPRQLPDLCARFLRDDTGLEILEWAFVAVLFAVAASAAFAAVSSTISDRFDGIAQLLRDG